MTIDPDNEELQKLKNDLEEVLTLTKDLIKQQLLESKKASGSADEVPKVITDDDIINTLTRHKFQIGDVCLAMNSDDGK